MQKCFYCDPQGFLRIFVSSVGRKKEKWKLWPWNKAELPSRPGEDSGSNVTVYQNDQKVC